MRTDIDSETDAIVDAAYKAARLAKEGDYARALEALQLVNLRVDIAAGLMRHADAMLKIEARECELIGRGVPA